MMIGMVDRGALEERLATERTRGGTISSRIPSAGTKAVQKGLA